MTLAISYRPKVWADLVGQETNVRILTSMLRQKKSHPFIIFAGVRGTGKTTGARILAKALNCEHRTDVSPCNQCNICQAIDDDACPDVKELDAASNGGVDSVREIKELVGYRTIMASHRVIILDEAHAMSRQAFQAYLKLLEEPPPDTTFVMCTTEVNAIPDTIVSRSFPFEYRRISSRDIQTRLSFIAERENLNITPSAIAKISVHVSGGMRDAITVMEQACMMDTEVTEELVTQILGTIDRSEISELMEYIISHNQAKIFIWTRNALQRGLEFSVVMTELLSYIRDMMAVLVGHKGDLTSSELERCRKQAMVLEQNRLCEMADTLMQLEERSLRSPIPPWLLLDTTLAMMTLKMKNGSRN